MTSFLLPVALVATLIGVLTPAHASPVDGVNFNPDDTFTTAATRLATVLSDLSPDGGTTNAAHLTTVATTDAVSVEWFYCDVAFTDADDPTAPPGGVTCTSIGTDASGTTPSSPASADEAYDLSWNIPASLDGATRDIVSRICDGVPVCVNRNEDSVTLDDGATGLAQNQTSNGLITAPAHGGTPVSNLGFTATGTTSADVTEVTFCIDAADAVTAPNGCDASVVDATPNNPLAQQSSFKTWSATFSDAQVPDSAEFEVAMLETAGGQGSCAGSTTDCQLDAHYVTSTTPVPTSVVIHFPSQSGSACESPVTSATNATGSTEAVAGCVFDQSGSRMTNSEEWAFQISPTDSANFSGEGTERDPNNDTFNELVNGNAGDAGSDNEADQTVTIPTAGSYTITFCRDANNDAGTSSTPCSGEALTATGTKTVVAAPVRAHAHNDEDTTPNNDAAPTTCDDGDRRKDATLAVNTQDNVLGCLFDAADAGNGNNTGNSMSTTATWEVSGAGATFGTTPGPTPDGSCDGTAHDHNADTLFEHCHFAAASDTVGISLYEGMFVPTTAGNATATFCYDPDQGNSAAAGHGCADASALLKDAMTKTVLSAFNFHPDDTFTGAATREARRLADRSDGVDSAAHLTTVASTNAAAVEWFSCPEAYAGADPTAGGTDCVSAGVDTSPTTPAGATADEAYDTTWDIPANQVTNTTDGSGTRDIIAWVCSVTSPRTAANCVQVKEDNVAIVDSGSVNPLLGTQPTVGEIVAPVHGALVSNGDVLVTARTSSDVTALAVCVDSPADALVAPAGGATANNCDFQVAATLSGGVWSATIPEASSPNDGEYEIAIIETTGGGNNCAGDTTDCQLDAHYVASSPGGLAPVRAHAHNDEDVVTNNDATPTTCQAGNRRKAATINVNSQDNVLGCIFSAADDASGNNTAANSMSTTATWEVSGAGGTFGVTTSTSVPDGSCDGTAHDHNVDGLFEHCHFAASSDTVAGVRLYEAVFVPTVVGTATATFCYDPDQGASAAPGHGCTDAATALKDSFAKTVQTPPTAGEARRIACTPASATNQPGTNHSITCSVDDGLNSKVPNVTVTWTKADTGGATSTFVSQGTTTNANGEVTATIRSNTAGSTSVTAALSPSTTECEEAAGAGQGGNDAGKPAGKCSETVQKTWSSSQKCPGFESSTQSQIVGSSASETLNGTNGPDIICGLDGNDEINGLGGDDILLGGNGNDIVRGGTGDDLIYGQVGNDIVKGQEDDDRVSGGDGADRVDLGAGNDRGWGGGGEDRIWGFAGNDIIYSNTDDDPNLRGGTGNDIIVGGSGDDGIVGEAGSDKGYGLSGNDRLYFRDGARDGRVDGGGGSDICSRDAFDPVDECP